MSEKVVAPAGLLAFTLEAAPAPVLLKQRRRHAPQHRQVLRGAPSPRTASALPGDHVRYTTQPVLHAPMPAGRLRRLLGGDIGTAGEVMPLLGVLALRPAPPAHHHRRLGVPPPPLRPRPLGVVDHPARPLLAPPS